MSQISLICPSCSGDGVITSTLPKTLNDPIRNVLRGCTPCGGSGSKVVIPKWSGVSNEVRGFYESGKGYEKGSGKVVVHYASVGGPCVHCGGQKCDKCYMTGKLVRFIRQTPFQSLIAIHAFDYRQLFLSFFLAIAAFTLFLYRDNISNILKFSNSQPSFASKVVHLSPNINVPFPLTGDVRWFVGRPVAGTNDAAQLTVTGLTDIGRNVVVRLDTWDAHAPIAMIPIRGGETATLQVPLGRYRITYAPNATWQGEFKLMGEAQEGIEPLDFYRSGNQVMGHRIDLNGRMNGNLKTRQASASLK